MKHKAEPLMRGFVERMNSSPLFCQAARGWNLTIQFRIIDIVFRAPLMSFAQADGEWWAVKVEDGHAELMSGDMRYQVEFRSRVEFETELDTLAEILAGRMTVARALLEDRLVAGGVLAHWAGTLIHLAQAGEEMSKFLSSGRTKAFLN